eukprot:snap_masked-scaffold_15-processed-gene-10.5-mRNA-1 protein AED:1.00 eAED:1.00 QI:0/-1/0/0/-1/1/1/0/219
MSSRKSVFPGNFGGFQIDYDDDGSADEYENMDELFAEAFYVNGELEIPEQESLEDRDESAEELPFGRKVSRAFKVSKSKSRGARSTNVSSGEALVDVRKYHVELDPANKVERRKSRYPTKQKVNLTQNVDTFFEDDIGMEIFMEKERLTELETIHRRASGETCLDSDKLTAASLNDTLIKREPSRQNEYFGFKKYFAKKIKKIIPLRKKGKRKEREQSI